MLEQIVQARLDLIGAAGHYQSSNTNNSVPRHHAQLPLKRLCLSGHRPMLRMHRPKVMTPTAKASRSDTTSHRGAEIAFHLGALTARSLIGAGEHHGAGVGEIHALRPLLHFIENRLDQCGSDRHNIHAHHELAQSALALSGPASTMTVLFGEAATDFFTQRGLVLRQRHRAENNFQGCEEMV